MRIATQTANKWLAGTDDHIYMTVHSNAGSCSTRSLDNRKRNDFERNRCDYFRGSLLGKYENRKIYLVLTWSQTTHHPVYDRNG